jgi:hypothetical protein
LAIGIRSGAVEHTRRVGGNKIGVYPKTIPGKRISAQNGLERSRWDSSGNGTLISPFAGCYAGRRKLRSMAIIQKNMTTM